MTVACRECGQRPIWDTDPRRSVPWSLCVECLREFAEGMRRRAEAALRLRPLSDFAGREIRSITITFGDDSPPPQTNNGPRL